MWVGHRPGSRDDAPILGPGPVDGLVYATGHHRNGILLTPITADAIARLVLDGVAEPAIRAVRHRAVCDRGAAAGANEGDYDGTSRCRRASASTAQDEPLAAATLAALLEDKAVDTGAARDRGRASTARSCRAPPGRRRRCEPGDSVEIVRARQGG